MNRDRLFSDRPRIVNAARRVVPEPLTDAIGHRMIFTDAASRHRRASERRSLMT